MSDNVIEIISCIFVIVFFAFLLFFTIIDIKYKKNAGQEKLKVTYDERQKFARSKAGMYGFNATILLNAIMLFLYGKDNGMESVFPIHFSLLITIVVGALVCISYAIWTSAIIGLNENYRLTVILFLFMTVMCIFMILICIMDSDYNGAYNFIILGSAVLITFVEMIAKNIYDKHKDELDEE